MVMGGPLEVAKEVAFINRLTPSDSWTSTMIETAFFRKHVEGITVLMRAPSIRTVDAAVRCVEEDLTAFPAIHLAVDRVASVVYLTDGIELLRAFADHVGGDLQPFIRIEHKDIGGMATTDVMTIICGNIAVRNMQDRMMPVDLIEMCTNIILYAGEPNGRWAREAFKESGLLRKTQFDVFYKLVNNVLFENDDVRERFEAILEFARTSAANARTANERNGSRLFVACLKMSPV
jgi:hypothetical protein